MNNEITVEVCCASLDDALEAQRGGADRIELNCGMQAGGLTATLGLLLECKAVLKIPVIAMVRPRSGGFCYTGNEFRTMLRDAEILLSNGADGIAFGVLNSDGTVCAERCAAMVSLTGSSREAVFNRAIDVVPDPFAALQALIGAGVKRVLTSGQKPKAAEGMDCIKAMRKAAGSDIEILMCGGIRAGNIKELLEYTGCNQVHFALPREHTDNSIPPSCAIKFSSLAVREDIFSITDGDGVAQIIKIIGGHSAFLRKQ